MTTTKHFHTRNDEIRFKTADTSRMLNKFIVRRVFKSWQEEAIDSSTGEKSKINRNELLFEKGTFIDREVLSSIQFYIASGDIKEIEVSNQKRLGYPKQNHYMFPYKASVKMDDKKTSFLLYANSIPNALTVLTDYVELNGNGGFTITDIKEMDFCIVLLDSLKSANDRKYELDIAYLNNQISMDEFVEGTLDGIAEDNKDADPRQEKGLNDITRSRLISYATMTQKRMLKATRLLLSIHIPQRVQISSLKNISAIWKKNVIKSLSKRTPTLHT